MLDAKSVKQFRAALEAQQQEVRRLVSQTQHDARGSRPEETEDDGDRANASESMELAHARSVKARLTLVSIAEALRRITDGTFGNCINCGQEIGRKRLEAVTWVRYCISCQESIESTR